MWPTGRHPTALRRVWTSWLLMVLGSRFGGLVLPWIVLTVSGSPWRAGLVLAVEQLPPLLFSGVLGTRLSAPRRQRWAVTGTAAEALVWALLAWLATRHELGVAVLGAAALLVGAADTTRGVAFSAWLPNAIGRRWLPDAHRLLEGADALATVLGPLVAGWLFMVVGDAPVLLVNDAALAAAALVLWRVVPESTPAAGPPAEAPVRWREGFATLWRRGRLRMVAGIRLAYELSGAAFILVLVLVQHTPGLTVGDAGIILSAAGVGDVVSVALLQRVGHWPWRSVLAAFTLAAAAGMVLLAASRTVALASAAMFLMDGALAGGYPILGAALQAHTPDADLGMVGGASHTLAAAERLGARFFGGAGGALGAPICLMLLGGLLVGAGTWSAVGGRLSSAVSDVGGEAP